MKPAVLSMLFVMLNTLLYGQAKDVNVDVNLGENSGGIMGSWWMWAAVILVLLVVILALTGRRRAD